MGGPPGGFGGPPPGGQPGYGAPPGGDPYAQQQQGGFGGPPQGGPPGYGAPQGGPPGYGAPQGGPPGGMNPYQQQQGMGAPMGGGAMVGGAMGQMMGTGGPGPNKRNPIMALLIPWGVLVVGQILAGILGAIVGILGAVMNLVAFVGYVYLLGSVLNKMLSELKTVAPDNEIATWMMWVPGINNIMCFLKVQPLMMRAKQSRGIQVPARPNWMYLIVPPFAFAADINDLA
jgi:hypothetical protein